MAKNSIRDYSATNSSNTDIQSIDISEGCSPAGINNAIREVMADLKDVSTGAVALESPAFDSASLTGDLTFGDNDKAVFGAGSDLQIYHDGSNSFVNDTGTGNLILRGANVSIQDASANNQVFVNNGGAVDIRYAGSAKLTTTAIGCDITGTVNITGDGDDLIVNSADYELALLGNRGGTGVDLDKAYFRMKAEGTNTIVLDTAGDSYFNGGNVLVGKTSTTNSVAGVELNSTGQLVATVASGTHILGRNTTDGSILQFDKDGSTVGSIKCRSSGGNLEIDTSESGIDFGGSGWLPMYNGSIVDNTIDVGSASFRFDDIYATNGTIQTSDANEKQQIAALTDAEMTAAKAISQLFKTFKWNSAVTEKGDAARTHAGVIAQDVQAAMTAAGLDAGDYAFFISNTWWETQTEVPAVEAVEAVLDEDGNVVTEAVEAVAAYTRTDTYETAEEAPEGAVERTRLGIRYPELLAFVGAATEQRLANIETRLAALEAN